jgi:tetratricopeptide (TPR) repeat protein
VILYQLVTGRLPFTGPTALDVVIQMTTEDPPPPSRFVPLPPDLEAIILRCLQKQPEQRYGSASDLAEDLQRFLSHEADQPAKQPTWRKKRSLTAGLLLIVAAVVGGVGATLGVHASSQRRQAEADARSEVEQILQGARHAAGRQDWKEVRKLIASISARVHEEPALAGLAAEVDELAWQAEGQLAARASSRAFERARDDALFESAVAVDAGQAWHARQRVLQALARVGAGARQGPRPGSFHTAVEKDEIRKGCYELVLVLADLTALRLRGQTDEQASNAAREALSVLRVAAGLGVRTPALHLRRARYLKQAGDDKAAQAAQAQARPVATWLYHHGAGTDHLRHGDVAAAERAFREALRLHPDLFWPRYLLALCQLRQGRELDSARDNLTTCLRQQPETAWLYLVRGLVQRRQFWLRREADADLTSTLALLESQSGPGASAVFFTQRGITWLWLKNYPAAEADLRKAIELAPGQYRPHVALAHVYLEKNDHVRARGALDSAVAAGRQQYARKDVDAGVLVMLYRARCRLLGAKPIDDLPAALADLRAITDLPEVGPGVRGRAHRDRGNLLLEHGHFERALRAYELALKRMPGDLPSHLHRAENLLRLKRYADAVSGFDRYLERGGRPSPEIYRDRGMARTHLGEHEKALADFTLALRLLPGDPDLLVQRGQTHLNLAQPRKAAADAEQAARQARGDGRIIRAAAGLLSQAAARLDRGRSPAAMSKERARLQGRAVALLRALLEQTPASQRRSFWARHIHSDPALKPLAGHSGFKELAEKYGRGAS